MRIAVGGMRKNAASEPPLDAESQRLLEFAIVWAPYGGAPEGDILVNFGLTTDRFAERLWEIVSRINFRSEDLRALVYAYPDRRRIDTAASNR